MDYQATGSPQPSVRTVEVRRVDPIQAGKIFAILHAVPALLFVPILIGGGLIGAFAALGEAKPAVLLARP